jgi:polyferredoxin
LSYKDIFPDTVHYMLSSEFRLGVFLLFWSVFLSFLGVPLLTYFFGKRWYCSWVCGCGGLANTAGDPWRHLSSKKLKAWQIERWSIHSVLVLITITTALLWLGYLSGNSGFGKLAKGMSSFYGFAIGSIWAGVIGTGLYPVMGTRIWCRFGCPQAAILGLLQKWLSRYRITTNGAQCISCGNCSTYCEMGIDVRWYAQRGQNIIRASCVGCGICSAVCPRGVLNLETGPLQGRYTEAIALTGRFKSGIFISEPSS